MNRRLLTVLVPVMVCVLAACGLVSTFVPPIEIGDIFGIGTPTNPTTLSVPAFQDPKALGPLKPSAPVATDYEATEVTFPDIDLPNTHGFTLDALWVTIGLGDTITLNSDSPDVTYPEAFTLTGVEAFIEVRDTKALPNPVEYHFRELDLDLTYRREDNCDRVSSCAYKTSASSQELLHAMRFVIPERDGNVVRDFITIVTEGDVNTALVKARLTAEAKDGNLTDLAATFQIMNTSTKVSLGG